MEHLHYYPNHEKIINFKPRVLFSGILNGTKGWSAAMHRHNFCEIMYITAGQGLLSVDGKDYLLRTGDVIVYNTGVFHKESCIGDELSILFFAVENINIPGMKDGCIVPPDACPVIEAGSYDDVLKSFLSVMVEELNEKKTHYKAISTSIASLFCYYILRLYDIKIESPMLTDICGKAKDYIDKNYQKDINLDSFASSFHVSKYYFARIFKEYTGLAPMKYLLFVRMSAAKALLSRTHLSIAKIAYEVGYLSALNFSRVFKNSENISPTEYRRNAQGYSVINKDRLKSESV